MERPYYKQGWKIQWFMLKIEYDVPDVIKYSVSIVRKGVLHVMEYMSLQFVLRYHMHRQIQLDQQQGLKY